MMELVPGDHDGKDAVLARDVRAELCTFERRRAESTAGEANQWLTTIASTSWLWPLVGPQCY